jgi:hypothetical protein
MKLVKIYQLLRIPEVNIATLDTKEIVKIIERARIGSRLSTMAVDELCRRADEVGNQLIIRTQEVSNLVADLRSTNSIQESYIEYLESRLVQYESLPDREQFKSPEGET